MAGLNFGDVIDSGKNVFQHSSEFNEGVKERGIRTGQGTVLVALDGSGDAESIQEGLNMLPSTGGVIYIKEGKYTITSSITFPFNNIAIVGAGPSTVIEAVGDIVAISIAAKQNIIIEKVLIDCDTGGFFATQRGIKITNPTHINITNVWITGGEFHAIDISGVAGKVIVAYCHLYSSNSGMGIYCVAGDQVIISNNHIHDNGDTGVYLAPGENSTVTGNIIESNGGDGITIHNADYNTVVGNRIVDNTGNQIEISEAGAGDSIKNIIVGNVCVTGAGGGIVDGGTNSVVANNTT